MKKLLSRLLLLPIYFYRGYISPMTPPSCRFVPTCYEYAIEAIKKHGPFKGLYLAVRDTTLFLKLYHLCYLIFTVIMQLR